MGRYCYLRPVNHLTIEGLTKRYGERLLFENLDISINAGEKVALMARNGKGKSTIFRILRGREDYDAGTYRFAPGLKPGFLDQNPEFDPDRTVLETVLYADNDAVRAIIAYETAVKSGDAARLDKALAAMDATAAWDYERQVRVVLEELGITEVDQRMGTLSGGEQKRVALARLWLDDPDMLLLDEPTNHLDLDIIEWLEGELSRSKKTLLMVTHDRYFLENVCDKIIEIDDERAWIYPGNYSKFLELKATRQAIEARTVEKARSLMRTELEWIRRMPKARGTKDKSRVQSFYELKAVAGKRLEEDELQLHIIPERLGSKIVEAHHVHLLFGDREIIRDFNYKFRRFERIGIIGKNGSGKSTLLNLITGNLKPSQGKVVIGDTVKFGYYHQAGMQLRDDKKVIDAVRDVAEFLPLKGGKKLTAAQLLEHFLFDRKQQYHQIGTLSGGERRRLYLLTLLMRNPNFLILDEPTNDLDIYTLNVLEDFLLDLQANLIIVSHDRFFMDKIAEHLFVLDGSGLVEDFPGNYSDYRQGSSIFFQNRPAEKPAPKPQAPAKPGTADNQPSYEARKQLKRLESSIEKLEAEKAGLEADMLEAADDYKKMIELQQKIEAVQKKIDGLTEEWMALAET